VGVDGCRRQLQFVPPIVRQFSTELSEVTLDVTLDAQDASDGGCWYITSAGFDVGYTLDLDRNLPPWSCSTCTAARRFDVPRLDSIASGALDPAQCVVTHVAGRGNGIVVCGATMRSRLTQCPRPDFLCYSCV